MLFKSSPKIRQVFVLYAVSVSNIFFGIGINYYLTRLLGPTGYGDYSLIINIFNISQILFLFGYFHSGSRLLASCTDNQVSREYYGSELVISLVIYAVMIVSLLVYAAFDANLKSKGLTSVLMYCIPFGFIFVLMNYFEVLLQGSNKIFLLAASRFWPRLCYLIGLSWIYIWIAKNTFTPLAALITLFISFIFTYYIIIKSISPIFLNLRLRLQEINLVNRTYGLHVYIGSLFAVGASSLTGILISYFDINNEGVGYFSLGMSLCSPLALIPNILGTAYFKDFANSNKINTRIFIITAMLSLSGIILIWLIAKPFILLLYGHSYLPAVKISYFLAVGFSLYGVSDLLNKFLGAHGQGTALRNSSFLVGALLLFSNVYFIKRFNVLGAAYSKILAGAIYFCCMYFYYRRYTNKISPSIS